MQDGFAHNLITERLPRLRLLRSEGRKATQNRRQVPEENVMKALLALYKTAALRMDRDLKAVLLFSLGGLILSLALLAILGAY
jgi:hypothetical protein